MKKVCFSIADDVLVELNLKNKNQGSTKAWMINEALRNFLGMKTTDKIFLDLPEDIVRELRGLCIESKTTINETANKLIRSGLYASIGKQSNC